MTAQIVSLQTFGMRNFINILQSMVQNIKNNISKVFFETATVEIEKAEQEMLSFYYFIASAESEYLVKYNFDDILENLNQNSEKIETILNTLKEFKNPPEYLKVFTRKLDDFYTAFIKCKIELSFITAELEYENYKAS